MISRPTIYSLKPLQLGGTDRATMADLDELRKALDMFQSPHRRGGSRDMKFVEKLRRQPFSAVSIPS